MLKNLVFALTLLSAPLAASIIKKPPAKATEITYNDFVCTEQDKSNVYEIISTMATTGKVSLLFNQSHLKELGTKINHLHPLKFLAAIFTNPELKAHMADVWNDSFKKNGFLNGLAPSLTREAEKGKLQSHIADFANEVGVSEEDLQDYFEERDWKNLVYYLIQS